MRKRDRVRQVDVDFMATLQRMRTQGFDSGTVEPSIRERLLGTFMQPSHGRLAGFTALHLDALERDPIFYGHLSRWYQANGSLRDHHELFCSHLLASPYDMHREHGLVLFQYLRPYQAARAVRYTKEVLHYPTRALRRAAEMFLRRREIWPEWFDECVIRDRQSMRYLYATLHVKPDARAESILFDERPPAGSRVAALKALTRLSDRPDEQARLILEQHLHFTTVVGAIKQYTPSIVYALVNVMTPAQVITNLNFLQKRGALQLEAIRRVVDEKLRQGVTESRVSEFKAVKALEKVSADGRMASELLRMTEARLRNRGRLTVPTAIFVDKSGSMQECIEVGKLLATLCSSIADNDLHVLAFDTNAFDIVPPTRTFAGWERAFRPIRADGGTSIGAPFRRLDRRRVEQVVVITDGEENADPWFRTALEAYEKRHNLAVKVVVIKVGSAGQSVLERNLTGRDTTVIPFQGDYYNLPNVVPLLCSGGWFELLEDILAMPLFTRDDLNTLPEMFNAQTCEVY